MLAYSGLREYFEHNAAPALQELLDNAANAGVIRAGIDPIELIGAIANLCVPPPGNSDPPVRAAWSPCCSTAFATARPGTLHPPARPSQAADPPVVDRRPNSMSQRREPSQVLALPADTADSTVNMSNAAESTISL